jgi:hypothetical protein
MSNGVPPLLSDPDDSYSNIVVYAYGWGAGSDRRLLGLSDAGHDDFVDHLHQFEGNPHLADKIRRASTTGYRWMVLHVDSDQLSVRFSRADRRDPFVSR